MLKRIVERNEYMESAWIGNVPPDWRIERLQWYLYEVNVKNNPIITEDILSLTNKKGVIPYEEKGDQGNKSKESLDEYKIAYKDTIVANSMNILIGSVGYCKYEGCVSPVYYVFKEKKENNLYFINYIMQTSEFQRMLRNYANGILEIRMRVSSSDILKRKVSMPKKAEQDKIVAFLDSKCQKIDDTIEKINKQIEVLKKYKQSLITEVVTKGLDKNAEMKDSGVEWIGKIPKDWEVKRLKYIVNSIIKGNGITKEEVIEDGDTPCVRYGELYTKYNHSFDKCVSYTNKDIIDSKQYFYKDNILFTCTGELIEEIGKSIVYKGDEKCLAGGDILVATTSENAEFINYVSNSYAQIQKSIGKAKLKVVHISAFDISNLLIAIPTLDEQNKIVEILNLKCQKIDNILDKKSKQIETLERYKKSLIYEYVTGKKRVAV